MSISYFINLLYIDTLITSSKYIQNLKQGKVKNKTEYRVKSTTKNIKYFIDNLKSLLKCCN